jgi:hypothetical protein
MAAADELENPKCKGGKRQHRNYEEYDPMRAAHGTLIAQTRIPVTEIN